MTTAQDPTPTKVPSTKIAAGGAAGALSTIIVWILGEFEVDVPAEIAAAITVLVMSLTSYFVPERKTA